MTPPTVGSYAQRLYDQLSIYTPTDEQLGWPYLIWLGALGAMAQPLDDIVRQRDDGMDGLTAFMDPDLTPDWALPWLAMVAGVQLSIELDPTQQRETIKQSPAKDRGKRSAIVGAARRYTTDPANAYVFIEEQYEGDPYRILVKTLTSQTPDPAAVARAVTADDTAPAGVLFDVVTDDSELWEEATLTWDAVGAGVTWDTASIGNV